MRHFGVISVISAASGRAERSDAPHAQTQSDPAAEYPSKPIRILVGFTPGGGPDITARHIALRLGDAWKQRAGGDGYTLLSVSSAHAIATAIYPKLPYDALEQMNLAFGPG